MIKNVVIISLSWAVIFIITISTITSLNRDYTNMLEWNLRNMQEKYNSCCKSCEKCCNPHSGKQVLFALFQAFTFLVNLNVLFILILQIAHVIFCYLFFNFLSKKFRRIIFYIGVGENIINNIKHRANESFVEIVDKHLFFQLQLNNSFANNPHQV